MIVVLLFRPLSRLPVTSTKSNVALRISVYMLTGIANLHAMHCPNASLVFKARLLHPNKLCCNIFRPMKSAANMSPLSVISGQILLVCNDRSNCFAQHSLSMAHRLHRRL